LLHAPEAPAGQDSGLGSTHAVTVPARPAAGLVTFTAVVPGNPLSRSDPGRALHDYLARYRFKIAEPAQLRAAFQAVTTTDLTAFWQRWRDTGD
jgi:hypothetical protein